MDLEGERSRNRIDRGCGKGGCRGLELERETTGRRREWNVKGMTVEGLRHDGHEAAAAAAWGQRHHEGDRQRGVAAATRLGAAAAATVATATTAMSSRPEQGVAAFAVGAARRYDIVAM